MTRGPDQEEHTVNRRAFLKGLAAAPAIGLLRPADSAADLPGPGAVAIQGTAQALP